MDDVFPVALGGVLYAGWPKPEQPVGPDASEDRTTQRRLFQGVTIPQRPSSLGGGGFKADGEYLPTRVYVDSASGWRWANSGGDWVDANGVSQGAQGLSTFNANAVSGSSAAHAYPVDLVEALNWVFERNLPAAFIIRRTGGARSLAGMFGSYPAPDISVT